MLNLDRYFFSSVVFPWLVLSVRLLAWTSVMTQVHPRSKVEHIYMIHLKCWKMFHSLYQYTMYLTFPMTPHLYKSQIRLQTEYILLPYLSHSWLYSFFSFDRYQVFIWPCGWLIFFSTTAPFLQMKYWKSFGTLWLFLSQIFRWATFPTVAHRTCHEMCKQDQIICILFASPDKMEVSVSFFLRTTTLSNRLWSAIIYPTYPFNLHFLLLQPCNNITQ